MYIVYWCTRIIICTLKYQNIFAANSVISFYYVYPNDKWFLKLLLMLKTSLIIMVYIINVCNMCIVGRRVEPLDLWVRVCLPAGGTQESNRYCNAVTNRYDDPSPQTFFKNVRTCSIVIVTGLLSEYYSKEIYWHSFIR